MEIHTPNNARLLNIYQTISGNNRAKNNSPGTQDIYRKIRTADKIFDLGFSNRFDYIVPLLSAGKKGRQKINPLLNIISSLLKKGIVGYEYLDVNNRPYKSFITTRIGDLRLSGAKPYRKKKYHAYI